MCSLSSTAPKVASFSADFHSELAMAARGTGFGDWATVSSFMSTTAPRSVSAAIIGTPTSSPSTLASRRASPTYLTASVL